MIITEVFPPAFNPRMGYLVKYLPEYGWDADIITNNIVKDNNYKFLVGGNKIVRVNLKHADTPRGFIQKVWWILNLKRHFINKREPFIKGIRSNFRKDDYSVILVSVSWDLFVLDAGFRISKDWSIPIIVDLRDIYEQKPVMVNTPKNVKDFLTNYLFESFENKKLRLRNKILANVNAITTISQFHVDELLRYNSNVILIYNGFDPELFNSNIIKKTSVFYIIYTGLVVENERDPTLLFEAVLQLEENKIIDKNNFKLLFYTPANYRSAVVNHQLYNSVGKYIEFYDYVDYNEVPGLLQRSSIALVLTNASTNGGPRGVLTTKFFEYLGAERPVLCVRSDEAILENIINEVNIGVSARSVNDAYNFILVKWNEWKENGYTTANVNQDYKQRFSRKSQARQFVNLFEKVMM